GGGRSRRRGSGSTPRIACRCAGPGARGRSTSRGGAAPRPRRPAPRTALSAFRRVEPGSPGRRYRAEANDARRSEMALKQQQATTDLTTEGAREQIDTLAKKYLDEDEYPWANPDKRR